MLPRLPGELVSLSPQVQSIAFPSRSFCCSRCFFLPTLSPFLSFQLRFLQATIRALRSLILKCGPLLTLRAIRICSLFAQLCLFFFKKGRLRPNTTLHLFFDSGISSSLDTLPRSPLFYPDFLFFSILFTAF